MIPAPYKTIKVCSNFRNVEGYPLFVAFNSFASGVISHRSTILPIFQSSNLQSDSGHFYISVLLVLFVVLIQKDRGFGPRDVLASYPIFDRGVVLNPIRQLAER